MITKVLNSFWYALKGLRIVFEEERNFKIEVFAGIILSIIIVYYRFTYIESALCVISMSGILMAEIINTAIEDLCNKVQPQFDPVIAKIKDVSGSFVMVSVFGSIIVGIIVFYHHSLPF
ncbi:diacylglycerol kinase [Patescibacteria group bacterium]|nr:diacylglycerol kinase [Patescibacteria group bacterium]